MAFFYRVKSRCIEVVFRRPKVGPCTGQERMERMRLEKGMNGGHFSPAVGWVVSLGDVLQHGAEEVDEILTEIQEFSIFQEEPRQSQGWAILIFFTNQVSLPVAIQF